MISTLLLILTQLALQNIFIFYCFAALADENPSDENSNALLEEFFLQEEIGEHPNILKVLFGGLFQCMWYTQSFVR